MNKKLEKIEKKLTEKKVIAKKLTNELKKIDKKLNNLTTENHQKIINYNRQSAKIKKRNEQKRKSRTHLLCICGGEYEKTFHDLAPEKAINFFEAIRKVFSENVQPEEVSDWLLWLGKQNFFQDWLDPPPTPEPALQER